MSGRLFNIDVVSPGSYGINLAASGDILDMRWAIIAHNLVIGRDGKARGRPGTKTVHTFNSGVLSIFEYIPEANKKYLIVSTNDGVYIQENNNTWRNISGGLSKGKYHFVNFNGRLVGYLPGQAGIVTMQNPNGNLALHSQSNISESAVGLLSAWGKVWIIDQVPGQSDIVKSSDLLDETTWFDAFILDHVWAGGRDKGVSLAEHDGNLVIFGEESIIIYKGDPDLNNMAKIESIRGVGCVSHNTVHQVGDETLFLSKAGVRGLGRTLREGKMAIGDLTSPAKERFVALAVGKGEVQAAYSQETESLVFTSPDQGEVTCVNVSTMTPLKTFPVTTWGIAAQSISIFDSKTYLGVGPKLVRLEDESDDGTSFPIILRLPWWGLEDQGDMTISSRRKMVKRCNLTLDGTAEGEVSICYSFDFSERFTCQTVKAKSGEDTPEYGEAEYGISEYGAGGGVAVYRTSLSRSGTAVQFEIKCNQLSDVIGFIQADFQIKIGGMRYG